MVLTFTDQGHIAIKVHSHQSTATLVFPFAHLVDHGTAFDIAGDGQADPTGLAAAVTPLKPLSMGVLLSDLQTADGWLR